MWKDWVRGICHLDFLITTKLVADQIGIDFGIADEEDSDDDDDDEEVDRPEQALVLAFRSEDGYPLLLAVDSNTPLDLMKRILRVYVQEVRSEC
jgi:hypothetical protein